MEEYLKKNVERYLKETGEKSNSKLRRVATPFLDEAREPLGCTTEAGIGEVSPGAPGEQVAKAAEEKMFNRTAAGIIMQTSSLICISRSAINGLLYGEFQLVQLPMCGRR